MSKSEPEKIHVHTERFHVLNPVPPFLDLILRTTSFTFNEFMRIAEVAAQYPNDPRIIEMVWRAGDASAKVPYLMDTHATAESIFVELQEDAHPYLEEIQRLPEPIQATITTLLSINTPPKGYDQFAIPALLELHHIQGKFIETLHQKRSGRKLASDFHAGNQIALQTLDADWQRVREKRNSVWPQSIHLPVTSKMQFEPVFLHDRLVRVHEVCVIVDAPHAHELHKLTDSVLRHPLPEHVQPPPIGSVPWFIRDIGKIGRHFTRALLDIIDARIEAEKISIELKNIELINQQAQDALRDFVEKTP